MSAPVPAPQVCDKYGCLLIMDASLLSDNLHFNKTREQVGSTGTSKIACSGAYCLAWRAPQSHMHLRIL